MHLRIPAVDAAFPSVISIQFQSFLNFVLGAENMDLENQFVFPKITPARSVLYDTPIDPTMRNGSAILWHIRA